MKKKKNVKQKNVLPKKKKKKTKKKKIKKSLKTNIKSQSLFFLADSFKCHY